jgi:hypothetical protein
MKNTLQTIVKETKNIFVNGVIAFAMIAVFLPFLTLAVKALLWIVVKTWNLI